MKYYKQYIIKCQYSKIEANEISIEYINPFIEFYIFLLQNSKIYQEILTDTLIHYIETKCVQYQQNSLIGNSYNILWIVLINIIKLLSIIDNNTGSKRVWYLFDYKSIIDILTLCYIKCRNNDIIQEYLNVIMPIQKYFL